MIRTLILAAALGISVAPARAQSTVPVSNLPIATAVNPQTDYAVGIVQQQTPAGLPFFATVRFPLSRLTAPSLAQSMALLPTTMPLAIGAAWNNGGILSIVQP